MDEESIVFTKHALERLDLRLITRDMVKSVVLSPAKQYENENGTVKFIQRIDGLNIHVVTKTVPEENKVLIVSAWVRGENDDGTKSDYVRPPRQYGNQPYGRNSMQRKLNRRFDNRQHSSNSNPPSVDTILTAIVILLLAILFGYYLWSTGVI